MEPANEVWMAREIRLRAEWRMGGCLRQIPENLGGGDVRKCFSQDGRGELTLEEQGINV